MYIEGSLPNFRIELLPLSSEWIGNWGSSISAKGWSIPSRTCNFIS